MMLTVGKELKFIGGEIAAAVGIIPTKGLVDF